MADRIKETDPFDTGADVWFLSAEGNWRSELGDEEDVDDELLPATPEDVVAVLGFDPLTDDIDDDDPEFQFADSPDSSDPAIDRITSQAQSHASQLLRSARREIKNRLKKKRHSDP